MHKIGKISTSPPIKSIIKSNFKYKASRNLKRIIHLSLRISNNSSELLSRKLFLFIFEYFKL